MNRREALRSAAGATLAAASSVPGRPASAAAGGPAAGAAGGTASGLPPEAVCLTDLEPLAKARIPHMAYEYIAGGAGDEITLRWNREAFDRVRLRPRVLVDVSRVDTRVSLFGQELPFPVLLAPTAYHRLVHPEGEIATARGAGAAGAPLVVSSFATTAVEDIAAAAKGPLWFQLYAQRDRGYTRDLVQRAEAAGCRALCLTVDTPVIGARNREARASFALPAGVPTPHLDALRGTGTVDHRTASLPDEPSIYSAILDPTLTWKDVGWLRSFARVPVLLKGVVDPDDAERAVAEGASGLIVSNHGARNLDTAPATIDALPLVTERVAGRIPVLLDGGVRRGTDVLKALALGARAVLIGRPYLYALGVGGDAGVKRALDILRMELEMALALCGRTSAAALDRGVLWA